MLVSMESDARKAQDDMMSGGNMFDMEKVNKMLQDLAESAKKVREANKDAYRKLAPLDWAGWAALHDRLRRGVQPRREEIWYAVNGLVPQTLQLLATLRQREPALFAWTS